MSQMRKDIFTDRWVIVEEGDELQPTDFHETLRSPLWNVVSLGQRIRR
jgi:hypothetical protein